MSQEVHFSPFEAYSMKAMSPTELQFSAEFGTQVAASTHCFAFGI